MPRNSGSGIFLGIGLSVNAAAADVLALVEEAQTQSGYRQIQAIATIASRRDSAVLPVLASHFGCDIIYFDAGALEAQTPRLKNPSETLFARIGCHGVAEAAALAAAGANASLIVEKMTGRYVTVAIAISHVVF